MRDDTPRGMADRYINLVILLHPLGWFFICGDPPTLSFSKLISNFRFEMRDCIIWVATSCSQPISKLNFNGQPCTGV